MRRGDGQLPRLFVLQIRDGLRDMMLGADPDTTTFDRRVADIYPGLGALAGLQAGLRYAANPHIFAAACAVTVVTRIAGGFSTLDKVERSVKAKNAREHQA